MEKKIATRTKQAAALAASALMAAAMVPSFASPEMAFAADETRTYTWANGAPQPNIPQTITGADGKEYHLTNQGAPVQSNGTQTVSQYFTQTVNSQIWPDQLGDIGNIVPRSFHVSADGFNGDIPRTGINYTPIYRNEASRVTATQDAYGNTQDAARASLPQTINSNGRTLTLGNVTFSEARKDSSGAVVLWKATGEYSVDVPRQVLDHYNVAAHYAGNLTKVTNNGDWSIQVTYTNNDEEQVPPEEEQKPEEENQDEQIVEMPPEEMDDEGNLTPIDDFDRGNYSDSAPDAIAETDEPAQKDEGIPIIPIAIAGGIVVAGVAVAGILVMRRKKKGVARVDASAAANVAAMPVAGAAAASAPMAAAVLPDDPQCQLIEVIPVETIDENGQVVEDYDQKPKAELEIIPSVSADIPTVIYFPSLVGEDGERMIFEAAEGAQYWIAIDEDTVRAVPSKEVVIASDEDNEIFRGALIDDDGDLTNQMMLDTPYMVGVVNMESDAVNLNDISEELARYDSATSAYIASAIAPSAPQQENEAAEGVFSDSNFDDIDSVEEVIDFDDSDMEDFDDVVDIDAEEAPIDLFEDDELEEPSYAGLLFSEAEDNENSSDEGQTTYDSDFEREMDDYDPYEGIDDPDSDGLGIDGEPMEDDFDIDQVEDIDELNLIGDDELGTDLDGMFEDAEIEETEAEITDDMAASANAEDSDDEYKRFQAMLDDIN